MSANPTGSGRVFTSLPPLSLYIHLPWCVRKCPYCDFNSHELREEIPEAAYVDALLRDLEQELPAIWGRTISTIFIGGGTPSLFSAAALERLFSGIRALCALPPGIEITLEANPGTVEQQRFADYRAIGINRLSLGIQSFDDAMLQRLGRIHDGNEAQRAIDIARTAGFDDLNIDLMYALPGQSTRSALADIEMALSAAPTHLSCYELTIEPNTLFARFPPALPDDDARWALQNALGERLSATGYERYEISAWAKPGRSCKHNLNYWRFGDYVGIGAGAHGKISRADTGTIVRRWKQKHPARYLDSAATAAVLGGESPIAIEDTALEFTLNALRLLEGFTLPQFEAATGVPLAPWNPAIDKAFEQDLLEREGLALRATTRGLDCLNDLLQYFLDDPEAQPGRVLSGKASSADASCEEGSSTVAQASASASAIKRYPTIPLIQEDFPSGARSGASQASAVERGEARQVPRLAVPEHDESEHGKPAGTSLSPVKTEDGNADTD